MLLTKLTLAYLVGDFLLQPRSWVKAKEKSKLRAYSLYLHALLHGIIIILLVWDWTFLPWAALLTFVHLAIDATKLLLQKKETEAIYFFAALFLHFLSIYLIVWWYLGNPVGNLGFVDQANLLLLTLVVFITLPCSLIVKMFIVKWSPHTDLGIEESLQDAGKYIGILERLFVFVFVITGHWEAVGFLLAAKSVFRFGDLKDSKDRKLTEYILIGTLASFGIAILTGIAYTSWAAK